MPLFGRHHARDEVPRQGGWTLFSRKNRSTIPNTTSTILPQGRNRDAKRSRRIARADARGARVPLATRVKRTLGIRSTPRRSGALGRVDAAGTGRRRGLFSGGTTTTGRRGRRGVDAGTGGGLFSGTSGRRGRRGGDVVTGGGGLFSGGTTTTGRRGRRGGDTGTGRGWFR